MLKIAHIINPVKVKRSSDLYLAQPITFETMKIAKEFAKDNVNVDLFSAQFSDDVDFVPGFFKKTKDLERSVLDLSTFKIKRKLPILKDILDRLFEASDADYFIYTNVDIGLLPHFYIFIDKIISESYDAFVINRRTISNTYRHVDETPLMYAEIGESHIGHDCFVFKRDAYPRYHLGNVCIGIRLVGRGLLWNLLATSKRFMEFEDLHMTFHLGENKRWKNPDLIDYDQFNHKETLPILHNLNQNYQLLSLLKEKYPDYLNGVELTSFSV